jgi:CRISPR-associated protein Csm2
MSNFHNKSHGKSHSHGGGGGGGYPPKSQDPQPDAPIAFYSDKEKTKLKADVFSDHAEKTADKIRDELNSAQLRRFFGEMKGYYQRWKNLSKSDEAFTTIFPLIKLMKSKVFYAVNPKKRKIPNSFANFLLGGINQIQDGKDFEAFILYFEAVVGFMYGKGMVSNR